MHKLDHEVTLKNLEFILNSIEKVKPGFLLSSMCMFPKSNRTKFWSHSFHLQNSGVLQTSMDQRRGGDLMKMNFDNFQIQKWISQTVTAQKADEKNGVICAVSFMSYGHMEHRWEHMEPLVMKCLNQVFIPNLHLPFNLNL